MKKLLIISAALAVLSLPTLTLANDCGQWQSKLKSTQRKLNNGGNQSQVRQWVKERDYYANTVERCQKKAGTYRWIETTGNSKRTVKTTKPVRSLATKNDKPTPAPATLSTTETFKPTRSLKECVKPNNRIDDEVKHCMLGQVEPVWRNQD